MAKEKAGQMANRFGDLFFQSLVGTAAEKAFKEETRKFCIHFTAAHLEMVALRGISLENLIQRSGFNLRPTAMKDLNPGQRYLVSLPNEKLLQLVREAVPPAHAVMLDRYPVVARDLIKMIKNMVTPG